MPLPLGYERGLEVRVGGRRGMLERLRELESALDVLPRGEVVALPPVATGAPEQDLGPEPVTREPRPLGQDERLVEERRRRRDAGELVPADAQPEEDVRALHVAHTGAFRERTRLLQEVDRRLQLAELHPRPREAGEDTNAHAGDAELARSLQGRLELEHRLVVAVLLDERLAAGERRLPAVPVDGRDAGRQELRVGAESLREPDERVGGRPRLSALDLADVLLREAPGRELRLRETCGDSQPPHALAELGSGVGGGALGGRLERRDPVRCLKPCAFESCSIQSLTSPTHPEVK